MILRNVNSRKFKSLIKSIDKDVSNTIQLIGYKVLIEAKNLN